MTGIDSWSTTPANNATADGGAVNWAEGMPPSAVNNTARQCLTDVRNLTNDSPWFSYGTGDQNASTHLAVPAVYASGTSFTIAGADVTLVYHVGRRLRAVGVSTGTIYGRISATSYSPTTTTVTVVWDSGSLSNETLVISISQIPITGAPIGFPSGSWTPVDASGASLSLTVVRATWLRFGSGYYCDMQVTYPVTADATAVTIGGLPGTWANINGVGGTFIAFDGVSSVTGFPVKNTTHFVLFTSAGVPVTNANVSGLSLYAQFMLFTV